MKLLSLALPALAAASAIPAGDVALTPSKTIEKRATQICGQWDTVQTGTYTLYQDLWGESAATSGSQCSTFNSLSGSNIAWSTSWTWQGGNYNVKSFANVVVTQSTGYQVSSISSIPSTWKYTYATLHFSLAITCGVLTQKQLHWLWHRR
jgi:xyloglucan-specific endo-beta-1,4-glucanase